MHCLHASQVCVWLHGCSADVWQCATKVAMSHGLGGFGNVKGLTIG